MVFLGQFFPPNLMTVTHQSLSFFQPQREILMGVDVYKCYVMHMRSTLNILLLVGICQQLTLCARLPLVSLSGTAEASCSTVPLKVNTFNTDM